MKPPSPPYRGPAANHGGHGNKPVHRLVIHGTVTPCAPGWAEKVARMFRTTTRPASCHYVIDPDTEVQVVWDSVIAYHAPPNSHSLGFELCDTVTGPASRWRDRNHRAMLRRAAPLVAQAALAYDVPIRRVGGRKLRAGARGICGHSDVRDAWGQTTHWDPGPSFPWRTFMRLVRDAAADLEAPHRKPRNTRVRRARVHLAEGLDLLDAAVKGGRTGWVRKARNSIRTAMKGLPNE